MHGIAFVLNMYM